MTEDLPVQPNVLPRETGRLTRLALDVQQGRNGWGAELTQVDLEKTQAQRVENTGVSLVSGEIGGSHDVNRAFHGEFYVVPERTLEVGAQAWERATEAAVALPRQGETTVTALQSQDRQYVASRLTKVRAQLAQATNGHQ